MLPLRHDIEKHSFWLLPEKALYWEQEKTLIIADLHFGKTGHFRKSGIAVPQTVYKEDLQRLFALIQFHKPEQLIIVGDMFHSRENKEMDFFSKWRNDLSGLNIELVKGNHDILKDDWYSKSRITVSSYRLQLAGFSFVHDSTEIMAEENAEPSYTFSGHVHPGIRITTGSRQSLSFPCFYFGKYCALLPAFSRFTGYALIQPKRGDRIYAITPPDVVKGEYGGIMRLC